MDKVDWENAPDWADRALLNGGHWFYADENGFLNLDGNKVLYGAANEDALGTWLELGDFGQQVMRTDEWQEGAERMEPIVQNGNDGEHYAELDNVNHPSHYQSDDGIECIDAIRAALGREGFIAYCRGNAIKYNWRSGKKSSHSEDLKKGAWYSERAAIELEKEKVQ